LHLLAERHQTRIAARCGGVDRDGLLLDQPEQAELGGATDDLHDRTWAFCEHVQRFGWFLPIGQQDSAELCTLPITQELDMRPQRIWQQLL